MIPISKERMEQAIAEADAPPIVNPAHLVMVWENPTNYTDKFSAQIEGIHTIGGGQTREAAFENLAYCLGFFVRGHKGRILELEEALTKAGVEIPNILPKTVSA